MEEGIFFYELKNGQRIMNEEDSLIFKFIMQEKPHKSSSYKWDEKSLAELFAKCYESSCKYCPESKDWFVYDGTRWVRDIGTISVHNKMSKFTDLMYLYCAEIFIDDDEIAKKYKTFIQKLGFLNTRERVIRDSQQYNSISLSAFDANPYLINTENGTYDLKEGRFREYRAADLITMKTNCFYPLPHLVIEFDRWEQFISEITCDNADIAKYLQKALGYSLCGVANEECMFIAYGKTTRNGKGTLFNTIYDILGDYAKAMPVDFISTSKTGKSAYGAANPMLASLKGARYVTLSESEDAGKLDEAQIKSLTGNDPVTARNLYEKAFTFIPQFKMWLSCNSLPNVSDKSLFSSERVHIIEFNRHFGENERDKNLKTKFLEKDAKAVIFKWLIDGYELYKKEGLTEPEIVKQATKEYEKKNDRVGLFVEERCVKGDQYKISRGDFYTSYKSWCKANGMKPMSAPKFNEEMERHAWRATIHGVRYWKGITLISLGGTVNEENGND